MCCRVVAKAALADTSADRRDSSKVKRVLNTIVTAQLEKKRSILEVNTRTS